MTPNVARYRAASRAQFPWIGDGGYYHCRYIGGTSTPSQHSHDHGNGDDAMTGPWNTATAQSRERQREIVAWLMETVTTTGGVMRRYQAYGIRTILSWRRSILTGNPVAGHTDHVHNDFWPTGYGTPPCMGGRQRVRYPNGAVGSAFILYPNVTIIEKESIVKTKYRTVRNVPADKNGNALQWAKDVIDWGISAKLINVDDDHPDDWDEVLTSGRYWSFEHRRRNA